MARRRTLLQMRTKVRQNLDEIAPGFWTNANLNESINSGKDRCWSEIRKLEEDYFDVTRSSSDGSQTILGETYDCASFAIASGVRDYTLPPDYAEMKTIECITVGQEHLRFTYRLSTDPQFRAALARTTPEDPNGFLYTIIGDATWRIAPPSNTALAIRLTYVAIVADLEADSDTLALPWPMHRAVEEYATADALMGDRAPESAAFEARGNSSVARFLGSNKRASTDPQFAVGYMEGEMY